MALVLPYPDLDFVPLDILTAEEMNQIVANYTHIANQFPITSDNIDFTTLNEDIDTSAIADSAVTLDKLQQVAMGNTTGQAGSVSFTIPDAKRYCYVLVVSKYESDGTGCGMYFIRFGAATILSLASTAGVTPTISISGNTITCNGVSNYAQWAVYAIMKQR